ncbi:MAG: right-handed parallel beta-helix repeat-containing protein [Actinomycetota bacterium]|nr:right-handed parallel beta-helix repeat-containing protein [Actinomycetota bacterium]
MIASLALATTPALPGLPAAAADQVVEPRTLYVSASGSDSADGLSPTTAWRSLQRANKAVLAPGDALLLEGGSVFAGPLQLDAADAGDAARPVQIRSYGTGRATVTAAGTDGISAYNTAGVQVRNLRLRGDAAAYGAKTGISFYTDLTGNRKLPGIVVAGVDVSGFRNGVMIGGWNGSAGFSDVVVSRSALHDNMASGLLTYGPPFVAAAPAYAHERVRVYRVAAYRNLGDPEELRQNTGSGIVLGSVRSGSVTWSRAHSNGAKSRAPEGPVGIWTYDSDGVVIQHNLAHGNRTSGADGGGFDLDQNVSRSVLQYNLSYDNDGPGYLLYTARDNGAHRGNVVRFNASSGDARRSGTYGAVTVWGRVNDAHIYNNTVVTKASSTARPAPLKLAGPLAGVTIRNNVFLSNGAGPVVTSPALSTASVRLQGNDYAGLGVPWTLRWGSSTHSSLSSWRAATKQEYVGPAATGTTVDPQLVDASAGLAVVDPADRAGATALSLRATSPMLGRGLALGSLFGVDAGTRDYFGNQLPVLGGPYDVGAHRPAR